MGWAQPWAFTRVLLCLESPWLSAAWPTSAHIPVWGRLWPPALVDILLGPTPALCSLSCSSPWPCEIADLGPSSTLLRLSLQCLAWSWYLLDGWERGPESFRMWFCREHYETVGVLLFWTLFIPVKWLLECLLISQMFWGFVFIKPKPSEISH